MWLQHKSIIWQTPLWQATNIFATKQLRIEDLAQAPSSGNVVVVGFEHMTFSSVVQHHNHQARETVSH